MKFFGRTSGYYLFWTAFIYFWVGVCLAVTGAAQPEIATLCFVLVLSIPLWCPPVARYFNMEPVMFDFFRFIKKNGADMESNNVVPFPEPKESPKMPYVVPPAPEPETPAKIFYRFGVTDNGRLAFQVGYSELTMNKVGVQNLIDQLEFFKNRMEDE